MGRLGAYTISVDGRFVVYIYRHVNIERTNNMVNVNLGDLALESRRGCYATDLMATIQSGEAIQT